MKNNFTSISVVIDASGSMASLQKDTVGSFNTFLAEQKSIPGEVVFTLSTFNTDYNLVHDFVKLASVPDLNDKTYKPCRNTALYDSVGKSIDSLGKKLAVLPENERPSKVLFLIITDGEENASKIYSKEQIQSMINHQKNIYNWEFMFFGASLDQITAAQELGVAKHNTLSYVPSAAGVQDLYKSVSRLTARYRSK